VSTKAQKKLQAAIVDFLCLDPFFGTLALSLPFKEDVTCDTAWVNGRNIGYNPTFIESLTFEETKGVLRHEVLHVAMGHPWRREGREHEQWNVACDLAINPDCGALPKGTLVPDASQKGKSAEWIFARLPQSKPQPKGNGQGQGKGTPQPGEVRDAPTGADEDGHPAPTEGEWKQRTAEALQAAKMQGSLPGGLARMVEAALDKRIDVRSLLLRFMTERTKADYAWSRPSPRYLAMSLYLPALESTSMGEVAVLVDTSGSTSSVALQYARGILEQVLDEVQPVGVTLYFVDTKIHGTHRMQPGDPLEWEPKGGGGTCFKSFFDEVERSDTQPVCIVAISDLHASFPASCSIPTLWLTDSVGVEAPFGETIFIDR
jgi:predicted metal-dependent peptidase